MNKKKLKDILKSFRGQNSSDGEEWIVVNSKDIVEILEALLEEDK